ncbi:MAG: hypothetical protein ACLUW6_01660 [Coriobacteriaceae bacterium]
MTNPKGIGLFRMVTTVITPIVGAGVFSVGRCGGRRRERLAILTAWALPPSRVLPRYDVLRAFLG